MATTIFTLIENAGELALQILGWVSKSEFLFGHSTLVVKDVFSRSIYF